MKENIRAIIIEDDFRVAEINRQLVEKVTGYEVEAILKTGDEAIGYLRKAGQLPDLILLDVFIPDRTGLELFWEIRRQFPQIAVVMLSAAKETSTVEETVRGGIFDYLVKPVEFERFERTLLRFREQKELFGSRAELDQADIDRLAGVQRADQSAYTSAGNLPKGIDELTLEGVIRNLRDAAETGINAMEMSRAVGVSRSTARRYLEYLVSAGKAKAQLNYGEIGRPERRYVPWTK